MWASAVVEALNPDPLVRTRLVGYHASVGRLVALITQTPFGRTNDADSRVAPLTGRELPGSILEFLGSSVLFLKSSRASSRGLEARAS